MASALDLSCVWCPRPRAYRSASRGGARDRPLIAWVAGIARKRASNDPPPATATSAAASALTQK